MSKHNIQSLLFICFLLTLNISCNMKINPPKAEKNPKKLTIHSDTRIDNYYWLNQREDEKVIEYLNQENSYTKAKLKPCLLYTSPSPRDIPLSRMPSSA